MSQSSNTSTNPIGISKPFKIVGVIILALLVVFGLSSGISGLQRNAKSVERIGVVADKRQSSPGGSSRTTYSVSSENETFQINGTNRSYEVGDSVTFWAVPGEPKADFNNGLSYDVLQGFAYAAGALAVGVFYWFYSRKKKR